MSELGWCVAAMLYVLATWMAYTELNFAGEDQPEWFKVLASLLWPWIVFATLLLAVYRGLFPSKGGAKE